MESSPAHLWFTVDIGAALLSDDKCHLLEPSQLLDEEHWLEDNELLALAARVMLGQYRGGKGLPAGQPPVATSIQGGREFWESTFMCMRVGGAYGTLFNVGGTTERSVSTACAHRAMQCPTATQRPARG